MQLCHASVVATAQCEPYHSGKDVVFSVFWPPSSSSVVSVSQQQWRPVMVKSRLRRMADYEFLPPVYHIDEFTAILNHIIADTLISSNGTITILPDNNEAAFILSSGDVEKLLYSIIPDKASRRASDTDGRASDTGKASSAEWVVAMQSLYALHQQREYVYSKYLSKTGLFPRVVGTCGHVYIVEKAVAFQWYGETFRSRAAMALQVLELLDRLNDQANGTMELCDIKPEHFGYAPAPTLSGASDVASRWRSSSSRSRDRSLLQILDGDTLLRREVLQSTIVRQTEHCSDDGECHFFDCLGRCKDGRCVGEVVNDNLQRICENVFRGGFSPGLLSHAPPTIAERLQHALDECIHSKNVDAGNRRDLRRYFGTILSFLLENH